jgi:hypothetical protein
MDVDVEEIRRRAAVEVGRLALEERFGPPKLAAVDAILIQKSAAAIKTDSELLKVAAAIRPGDPLAAYEELGGTYSPRVED